MERNYKISGMTCGGWSLVEKTLNGIDGVKHAIVTFPDQAVIEMNRPVDIETMQGKLARAGNYSIEMLTESEIAYENPARTNGSSSHADSQPVYRNLWAKMKIALLFTVTILAIAMADMTPYNPLDSLALVVMGTGVAWLFNMTALLFPSVLPD